MARRVKDFIEISEFTSLDDLIKFLKLIRDTVPKNSEAELDARYTGDALPEPDAAIEQLRQKLDKVPYRDSRGG